MSEVREPIKHNSILKKNTIIEKGFELMCEKGYHNVTCVDIAKYAGVSTGIIYQYFNDKRDIFLCGVKNYAASILYPMVNVLEQEKIDKNNIEILLNKMIDNFVKKHTITKKAHEELNSISHSDKEIADILNEYEIQTTQKIANILINNGYVIDNINEKVHIIYGIIDNYCHEIVYHKHESLVYEKMKSIIVDIIKYTLFN